MAETTYVVLRLDDSQLWEPITEVHATDDVRAIKAATADQADKAGTFVAIPTRSWRPRTRTVETVQKDIWS